MLTLTRSDMEEYTGKFYKQIYRNDDGSYCVNLYTNKGETTTVVGANLPETAYKVTFMGRWKTNATYGRQFIAETVVNALPKERDHICRFIADLKIGIGVKRCRKMVELVGEANFWHELDADPVQFTEIPGVQMKYLLRLQEAVAEANLQSELLKLFGNLLPLTAENFKEIQSYMRSKNLDILPAVKDNPFILQHCGYSFKELDFYASRYTVRPLDDPDRLYAAAYHVLTEAKSQSHVALPEELLLQGMDKILSAVGAVTADGLHSFLSATAGSGLLMEENGLYYLPRAYQEECCISDFVERMVTSEVAPVSRSEFDAIMEQYAQEKGFSLSQDQQQAVWTALNNRLCIITGGPGTGKSTILDALLRCWRELRDQQVLLMAPTGKASVRMAECTGEGAATIHSALGLRTSAMEMEEMDTTVNTVFQSLVVIDEASMCDQTVLCAVAQAVAKEQHLVIVGDPDQLPSVGWGNILADMIASDAIPVCRLHSVYRQGKESPIIANAQRMLDGNAELDWSDRSFRRYHHGSDKENMDAACRFYRRCVAQFGIENVMLLSPYRKATEICTNSLNQRLQEALNPFAGQPQITAFGRKFRVNDRVIQLKNTEMLSNGDVGTITTVNPCSEETEPCLEVTFENGITCGYLRESLSQLDLAYAMSVHKAQGSQSKVVLIILPTNPSRFLKENLRCNLLYTAITRSEENVAIFSSLQTIADCIHSRDAGIRYTGLADRLRRIRKRKNKAA